MTGAREQTKFQFSWLTVFVLLVIVGLAALGLNSLKEDRRVTEQDAQVVANALATSLAHDGSVSMIEAIRRFTGETEASRNALVRIACGGDTNEADIATNAFFLSRVPASVLSGLPRALCFVQNPGLSQTPDFPAVPETPEWLLETPADWLEKWQTAERHSRESPDSPETKTQLEEIEKSDIHPLDANAQLRLAEIEPLSSKRKLPLLFNGILYNDNPTTPSGTPIADLALLNAIQSAPSETWFGKIITEIASREFFHPSFLTGKLLDELDARARQDFTNMLERVFAARVLWSMEQNTRPILSEWRNRPAAGRGIFHTRSEGKNYFLFVNPSPYILTNVIVRPGSSATNVERGMDHLIAIVPDSVLANAIQKTAAQMASRWPRYFSAEMEMAGIRFPVISPDSKSHAENAGKILATTGGTISGATPGVFPFTISVRLANPTLLFQRQRMRVLIFGALVIAAGVVALFGAWQLQKNLSAQLRLNEQKSNFVSSVSHELRAPIASVRLMAESLERGKISGAEKQNEYFRFIVQECRRLSSLIENVLDFSRIELGRKQYEFEPTDMLALARETVKLMEPYATEKGVRLEFETSNIQHRTPDIESQTSQLETPNPKLETRNVELNVDGRAIQQALVNLIDNAIKHSAKNEVVKVELLEATPSARSGNHFPCAILLSVSDSGPGIPESEREKIFDRFYRRGSELRRETQGVGIGLSIVKHIVEAHGGMVKVESEVGKGSRFIMEFSLNRRDAETQRSVE
ncbi:MAG TPA: HAMP domain-containing sensor histidine kinase [Verrucomicrobiae bacterium]|nr:HAMP domain-containing sensor histidine kinase [Verrucomicrobiae bacterium]